MKSSLNCEEWLKILISIDYNTFSMSETFKKSQMSEFFDVSSRWHSYYWKLFEIMHQKQGLTVLWEEYPWKKETYI